MLVYRFHHAPEPRILAFDGPSIAPSEVCRRLIQLHGFTDTRLELVDASTGRAPAIIIHRSAIIVYRLPLGDARTTR